MRKLILKYGNIINENCEDEENYFVYFEYANKSSSMLAYEINKFNCYRYILNEIKHYKKDAKYYRKYLIKKRKSPMYAKYIENLRNTNYEAYLEHVKEENLLGI
jgi:hypothetical protein